MVMGAICYAKRSPSPATINIPLLSNMPSTWLPPLSTIEVMQAGCMSLTSACTHMYGNGELFPMHCWNINSEHCIMKPLYREAASYLQLKFPINMKLPFLIVLVPDKRARHDIALLFQTHMGVMWHRWMMAPKDNKVPLFWWMRHEISFGDSFVNVWLCVPCATSEFCSFRTLPTALLDWF